MKKMVSEFELLFGIFIYWILLTLLHFLPINIINYFAYYILLKRIILWTNYEHIIFEFIQTIKKFPKNELFSNHFLTHKSSALIKTCAKKIIFRTK